ncbi:MAG: Bifunctional protein FolD protein [Chlamydiae bacterium]|nr:Bifunctional protein FolD protein [Chlamydiota bacterium]
MILYGDKLALTLQEEMRKEVAALAKSPSLAVILVGENPASLAYIKRKQEACLHVGIESKLIHLPSSTSEQELLIHLSRLNSDPDTDGIIVQLPLPPEIDPIRVIETIDPKKDVDGFHPENLGKLVAGIKGGFIPCTPLGIQTLLVRNQIETKGRHVVIVGRSTIVGKPLASLLLRNEPGGNATVTVAHSQTENLASLTKEADILVAAVGKPRFLTSSMVKQGAVVIDVGINRIEDPSTKSGYRLVGDVDFQNVEKICRAITPVPKGVGPLTVAMLLRNTIESAKRRRSS